MTNIVARAIDHEGGPISIFHSMKVAAVFGLKPDFVRCHVSRIAFGKHPAVIAGPTQAGVPAESAPAAPVRQSHQSVRHPRGGEEHLILKEPYPVFPVERGSSVTDKIVFQVAQPDLMNICSFFQDDNGILDEIWIPDVQIVVLAMKDVIGGDRPVRLVYRARLPEIDLVEDQVNGVAVLSGYPVS